MKFKNKSNYQLHKTGFPSCVCERGQTVAMFIVKEGLAIIAGCIQPGQALARPGGRGRPRVPGKRAHLQCAAMRMRRSPLRVNSYCPKPVITSQVAGINRLIALYIYSSDKDTPNIIFLNICIIFST